MKKIEILPVTIKLSKSIEANHIRISEVHTSLMFRIGRGGMEFLYPHNGSHLLIGGVDVI